jgi:hypothetical protein
MNNLDNYTYGEIKRLREMYSTGLFKVVDEYTRSFENTSGLSITDANISIVENPEDEGFLLDYVDLTFSGEGE